MFLRRSYQVQRAYATRANWRSFFVNGDLHTFTWVEDRRDSADLCGQCGNFFDIDSECKECKGVNSKTMAAWLTDIEAGRPVENQCFGGLWKDPSDLSYCDPA